MFTLIVTAIFHTLTLVCGQDFSQARDAYWQQSNIPVFDVDAPLCSEGRNDENTCQCNHCGHIDTFMIKNGQFCIDGIFSECPVNEIDCTGVCGIAKVDCAGVCQGTAVIDDCGICSGGTTGNIANIDKDCAGVCDGTADTDDCGICSGGTSGNIPNADKDCSGDCFGSKKIDCAGVCGGTAVIDDCGICSQGTTGNISNIDKDCAGICFGNSKFDCAGTCGGNAAIDQCGKCSTFGTSAICSVDDQKTNGVGSCRLDPVTGYYNKKCFTEAGSDGTLKFFWVWGQSVGTASKKYKTLKNDGKLVLYRPSCETSTLVTRATELAGYLKTAKHGASIERYVGRYSMSTDSGFHLYGNELVLSTFNTGKDDFCGDVKSTYSALTNTNEAPCLAVLVHTNSSADQFTHKSDIHDPTCCSPSERDCQGHCNGRMVLVNNECKCTVGLDCNNRCGGRHKYNSCDNDPWDWPPKCIRYDNNDQCAISQTNSVKYSDGIGRCSLDNKMIEVRGVDYMISKYNDGSLVRKCIRDAGTFSDGENTFELKFVWGQDISTASYTLFPQNNADSELQLFRPKCSYYGMMKWLNNRPTWTVVKEAPNSTGLLSFHNMDIAGSGKHPEMHGGLYVQNGKLYASNNIKSTHPDFCGDTSESYGKGFNSNMRPCIAVVRKIADGPQCPGPQTDQDKYANGIGRCKIKPLECVDDAGTVSINGKNVTLKLVWGQDIATASAAMFPSPSDKKLELFQPECSQQGIFNWFSDSYITVVKAAAPVIPVMPIYDMGTMDDRMHSEMNGGMFTENGIIYASENTASIHPTFCGSVDQPADYGFNSIERPCIAVVRNIGDGPQCPGPQTDEDKYANGIGRCKLNPLECVDDAGTMSINGKNVTLKLVWGQDIATASAAMFPSSSDKTLELFRPGCSSSDTMTWISNTYDDLDKNTHISLEEIDYRQHSNLDGGLFLEHGMIRVALDQSGQHPTFCGDVYQQAGDGFNRASEACLAVVRSKTDDPQCPPRVRDCNDILYGQDTVDCEGICGGSMQVGACGTCGPDTISGDCEVACDNGNVTACHMASCWDRNATACSLACEGSNDGCIQACIFGSDLNICKKAKYFDSSVALGVICAEQSDFGWSQVCDALTSECIEYGRDPDCFLACAFSYNKTESCTKIKTQCLDGVMDSCAFMRHQCSKGSADACDFVSSLTPKTTCKDTVPNYCKRKGKVNKRNFDRKECASKECLVYECCNEIPVKSCATTIEDNSQFCTDRNRVNKIPLPSSQCAKTSCKLHECCDPPPKRGCGEKSACNYDNTVQINVPSKCFNCGTNGVCDLQMCRCNAGWDGMDCSIDVGQNKTEKRNNIEKRVEDIRKNTSNVQERQEKIKKISQKLVQSSVLSGKSLKESVKENRVDVSINDLPPQLKEVVKNTPRVVQSIDNSELDDNCHLGASASRCATHDLADDRLDNKTTIISTGNDAGSWTVIVDDSVIVSKQTKNPSGTFDMQCWDSTDNDWEVPIVKNRFDVYQCGSYVLSIGSQFTICDHSDCENGGSCTVRETSAECECLEGWSGPACETPICVLARCQNGGSCTSNSSVCVCPVGWSGPTCETPVCVPERCQNGGSCTSDSPDCDCPLGWTGPTCETATCAFTSSECLSLKSSFQALNCCGDGNSGCSHFKRLYNCGNCCST